MNKVLYVKAQINLIALACAVRVQAEKWDKDPSWVSRKSGKFSSSGNSFVDKAKSNIGDAADVVKKSVEVPYKSFEEAVESIKSQFNKAASSVKDGLDNLMKSGRDLDSNEKQRISDAISSPSGKKVRKKIGSVLKKISPEAAEVFDDATGEIEKSFDKKPLKDAINSALDIAGKSAQKVGEASLKAGKTIAPAAVVLGGLAAVAATGGAAGVLMVGGAVVAAKNWSIPNSQGKGGKQAAEAFLTDSKNRRDWVGHENEYLKGAVSNLAFTAGLHTAVLASVVLLAEVSLGTLDSDKKAFIDGLSELAEDTEK